MANRSDSGLGDVFLCLVYESYHAKVMFRLPYKTVLNDISHLVLPEREAVGYSGPHADVNFGLAYEGLESM